MMRDNPTKKQRDEMIASLENKQILPPSQLTMLPLPSPIDARTPPMSIMKIIKERHDYLIILESFFRVLEKAFLDPFSIAMEKQNEAELVLKVAYLTGGVNEKQFYEAAALSGFCKDASLTETEWDSIKANTIAQIESGDSNAEINFITAILYNNIGWATQEDTLLALGLLWQSAIDDEKATIERCVNAQYALGKLFWEGLTDVVNKNLGHALYWLGKASRRDPNDIEVKSLLAICKANREKQHFYLVNWQKRNGFERGTFDTGAILGIRKIDSVYDKRAERSSLFSRYKNRTISDMFNKPDHGVRKSRRRKIL